MFSSYGELCTEVYNLTKPVGQSYKDVEYYKERLKSCKGRILEIAVGSGRALVPLLKEGFIIDGIDNSLEMLASCKKHCADHGLTPDLYEGQMQKFALPIKYEAIIIPGGSFLLVDDREESLNALKCYYNHLINGGRLIFDIFLQKDFSINVISTRTFTTPNGEVITLEDKRVEVDLLNQRIVSYLKYEKWSEGKLLKTELQRFPIRWYGIEELKLILEKIGFCEINVSADHNFRKSPSHSSQSFTFEATKSP